MGIFWNAKELGKASEKQQGVTGNRGVCLAYALYIHVNAIQIPATDTLRKRGMTVGRQGLKPLIIIPYKGPNPDQLIYTIHVLFLSKIGTLQLRSQFP